MDDQTQHRAVKCKLCVMAVTTISLDINPTIQGEISSHFYMGNMSQTVHTIWIKYILLAIISFYFLLYVKGLSEFKHSCLKVHSCQHTHIWSYYIWFTILPQTSHEVVMNTNFMSSLSVQIKSDKIFTGEVIYKLEGPGVDQEPKNLFEIDDKSGVIRSKRPLDREKDRSFTVREYLWEYLNTLQHKQTEVHNTSQNALNETLPVFQSIGSCFFSHSIYQWLRH